MKIPLTDVTPASWRLLTVLLDGEEWLTTVTCPVCWHVCEAGGDDAARHLRLTAIAGRD